MSSVRCDDEHFGACSQIQEGELEGSSRGDSAARVDRLDPASAPAVEEVARAAEHLVAELEGRGIDVLYDDRNERPGVKFKDADLIGVPIRAVVGGRGLAAGEIELSLRRDKQKIMVPVADAVAKLLQIHAALAG